MSRNSKVLVWGTICLVAAVVIVAILPVQAAKPSPPLSLQANFEAFWQNGSGQYIGTRIHNDIGGFVYTDTASTKRVVYGVEVKYYPPASSLPGQFVMKIERSGVLGRFVRLDFQQPSTDPVCDESGDPGCAVDPLYGGVGELETKTIRISTQGVLTRRADGALVQDINQRLDMDKMQSGQSKLVGLGITFTPTDPAFDRNYNLGILVNPDQPHENIICPVKDYWLFGTAELYCVAAGSLWEFRTHTQAFTNEPDNVVRLLHTNVQLDYLNSVKLRTWRMPFVLRVWK